MLGETCPTYVQLQEAHGWGGVRILMEWKSTSDSLEEIVCEAPATGGDLPGPWLELSAHACSLCLHTKHRVTRLRDCRPSCCSFPVNPILPLLLSASAVIRNNSRLPSCSLCIAHCVCNVLYRAHRIMFCQENRTLRLQTGLFPLSKQWGLYNPLFLPFLSCFPGSTKINLLLS